MFLCDFTKGDNFSEFLFCFFLFAEGAFPERGLLLKDRIPS